MTKFIIRTNKKSGSAPVYARVRKSRNGEMVLNLTVRTDVVVDIQKWNNAIKSKTTWDNFLHDDKYKSEIDQIESIRKACKDLADNNVYDIQEYYSAVNNVTRHASRAIQMEESKRFDKESNEYKQNVSNYLNYFITGISDGSILSDRNKRYSKGSIIIWRQFKRYWDMFDKSINFSDISKKTYTDFISFMRRTKLMDKTIEKNIKCARVLFKKAQSDEIEIGKSLQIWGNYKVEDKNTCARTYLTSEELMALYNMELKKGSKMDKVRDIFCIQCFLCQRVSDIMNMKKSNFDNYDTDGIQYFKVNQIKTGSSAFVSLSDKRPESKYIKEICKKYDYNFPSYNTITYNNTIKNLLHKLSESVPSLNETFETAVGKNKLVSIKRSIKETGTQLYIQDENGKYMRPKWDIITSHSGRRTGITLEYKRHLLSLEEICIMSGHKSVDMLRHYISMGEKEKELDKISKLKAAYK
jgi:integrase